MQSQKRQRFETTARLDKQIERVRDLMNTAVNSISEDTLMDTLDVKPNMSDLNALTKTSGLTNGADSSGISVDNTYEKDALMCDFVEELALQ